MTLLCHHSNNSLIILNEYYSVNLSKKIQFGNVDLSSLAFFALGQHRIPHSCSL